MTLYQEKQTRSRWQRMKPLVGDVALLVTICLGMVGAIYLFALSLHK